VRSDAREGRHPVIPSWVGWSWFADIFIGAIPFTIVIRLVTILLVAVPKLSLVFL